MAQRFFAGINLYAYAQESFKINNINFDNSDSIIFLGTSGNTASEKINIKKSILTEPDRTVFDIENAVITFPNSTYSFKNSRLQKAVIAQNSTAPDIVRVVLWNSPNYNPANIKVLNINNNIIIKLNNSVPQQKYQTQIYRETKERSADYYDKTIIFQNIEEKKESDEIFDKVQKAFKENEQELVRPNIEQKRARLKSRFFVEKAYIQNSNIILSGIGVINISKPFTLQEPSRVVFDLPNTILQDDLKEKEFSLPDGSSVKLGQFTPSTTRVVIRTENVDAYMPVYSRNLQTLLIANTSDMSNFVTSSKSTLTYFKEDCVNINTDVVNIVFSEPVIYSIKRYNTRVDVTFYNLTNFNVSSFNQTAIQNKTGYTAKQTGTNTYRISFPIKMNTLVDGYETLDAKQLRFLFTTPSEKVSSNNTVPKQEQIKTNKGLSIDNLIENQNQKRNPNRILKPKKDKRDFDILMNKIQNKVIIIDPGHGGNDTGAMRNDILEKDITLQIALKVRNILNEKGFSHVIMTRAVDTTLTLQDRVEIANTNNADIYVSIHINASVKNEVNGVETHYYNEGGYDVAQIIHKELMKNLEVVDRGLFKSKFYVINHTEAPAVLLELGFISNERERNELISEQRQMNSAQAIADGITEYLTEQQENEE